LETAKEVGHIYGLARELMETREKDYEGSWRDEGLVCMVASSYKKASQIKVMVENGRWKENTPRVKEDLLDMMNYGALAYRLVELMEKMNKGGS